MYLPERDLYESFRIFPRHKQHKYVHRWVEFLEKLGQRYSSLAKSITRPWREIVDISGRSLQPIPFDRKTTFVRKARWAIQNRPFLRSNDFVSKGRGLRLCAR